MRSSVRFTITLSEWISLSFSIAASVDSNGSCAARISPGITACGNGDNAANPDTNTGGTNQNGTVNDVTNDIGDGVEDAVDDVEDGVDDMTRNRTEDRNVNDNHTIDGQE